MELLQHLPTDRPTPPAPCPPKKYISFNFGDDNSFFKFVYLFVYFTFLAFYSINFYLNFFLCTKIVIIFQMEGFGMFRVPSFIDSQRELLRLLARSFVGCNLWTSRSWFF